MNVQNNTDQILAGNGYRLVPGGNVLTAAQWQDFKSRGAFVSMIESGEVVAGETEDGREETIADMTVSRAGVLIRDTFTNAVLDQFQQQEEAGSKRETVLKAIQAQRDKLNKEAEEARKKAVAGEEE